MRAVGQRNTKPEMTIRRWLHAEGYRYRLHRRDLPGTPDIVFPGRRKAVFINGCFWHGHDCPKGRAPKSRTDYWGPKIRANQERDDRVIAELTALGWGTQTVWQCELRDWPAVQQRLRRFLA
jgi:DNA mismatch endonuclease (patch repair protein)